MNRKDIERRYLVSEGGIIETEGEYQNLPVYAPYFYDCAVAQHSFKGEGRESVTLVIAAQDREEYPELGRLRYVRIESDAGKFHSIMVSNDLRAADGGG